MNTINEKLKQLNSFNWRLFIALCAWALVPAVYNTVKTFIISTNSGSGAFDIIGQMEWFDLINETLQAFLIIPLYSILNKITKYDKKDFSKYVFKMGLVVFALYALCSSGVLIYGSAVVRAMNLKEFDIHTASRYLQLETIAFMVGIIVSFVNVVFVIVGKDKNVYIFLIIHTVLSIIVDFILIPHMGVYGVALSNIIVNSALAIASFIILYKQSCIKPCLFHKSDIPYFKDWGRIGAFSGLQQLIDNFMYAIMIGRMVNMVAEQGNYWIANNFIWGWLLIPITAMAKIIRRDCKDGYENLRQSNYYFVAFVTVLLWAITIPVWIPFFKNAQRLANADEIFFIVIKLVPFYIAYAGCTIIDNIFIGLGKTKYNAINSFIINFIYYGFFFVLYLTKTIRFTMDTIIHMFGWGMVVHFALSLLLEKVFFKRE